MRKIIIAMLLALIMISGCSNISTAPKENDYNELVMEIEAAAETESSESISFSESEESEAQETDTNPETEAEVTERVCETAAQDAPAEHTGIEASVTESAAETNSSPTEKPQETTKPTAEAIPPAQTQQSVEEQPQTTPEETKPKSAYDFEFDIEAIKADCICIGQAMGLSLDSSLTPSNSTWWNPVTASQSNQGEALKRSLESYITFHTADHLSAYGMDEITVFNIYCEARGNGSYSIYFLFA